jgi:L-lactate dehydrogenase (cytochrome)
VFDYVDGGAEQEVSLARARAAFLDICLLPEVLADVWDVDLSTSILGKPAAAPIIFAPTGFTRMMHHSGERAVARVAAESGLPYSLSTMGTTSLEDLADAAQSGRRWFQLYLWRDRTASAELIARAAAAGYEALILTVDTPVAGARLRDVRNGLTIPPAITARTFLEAASHPRWWGNLLTTEPLQFASLQSWPGTVAELVNDMFDPAATYRDLHWLRENWKGPLIIKGIATVADAVRVADAGADAIVLSSHGGRQLDRAAAPLHVLPKVRDAVGDRVEIYLDTGILTGSDIAAACALGATACLIGRAYLYGLMAGGQAGVARAITILTAELTRTLQLLGVDRVPDLAAQHVGWADKCCG